MPTVKPVSITDNTPEGARAFLQHVQHHVRRLFRIQGGISPVAFMVGDRDPKTCEMLDEPAFTYAALDMAFFASTESKNQLGEILNGMAVSAGAFGMAFVVEAWFKRFTSNENMEAFRAADRSLNDLPPTQREELVQISFEHHALPGSRQKLRGRLAAHGYFAIIHRPGRGKPRLGPWMDAGGGHEGRFVGLLPDDDYLNRAAIVLTTLQRTAKLTGVSQAKAAEIIARGNWHQPGYPPPAWLARRMKEMEW